MTNTYYKTKKLTLTAFIGKEGERNSLQITMPYGKEYASLNEEEALGLAINILLRVNKNISATGEEEGIYKNEKE